jgi:hypothetical protein
MQFLLCLSVVLCTVSLQSVQGGKGVMPNAFIKVFDLDYTNAPEFWADLEAYKHAEPQSKAGNVCVKGM